jgi:3'-phosphoadenosine 5'-phosphosulfate (PAPS) 3'-phosphatase
LLEFNTGLLETKVKSTAGDYVTKADLASEKIIIETIRASFSDDLIISEETVDGQELLTDELLSTPHGLLIRSMEPITLKEAYAIQVFQSVILSMVKLY